MPGQRIEFDPDAKRGNMKGTQITLSATPDTVTTIDVPDDALGVRFYSAAATCRWNLGAAPAAQATVATNDQTAVASDFADGGYIFASQWENRYLEMYPSRVIHLMSATASAVVYVEFF